ncbi:MAG: biopolymer transporter ExbD [Gammaproteobacteria bacterium]
MRRRHSSGSESMARINVVPLVDVMVFLLIFFVSTASFLKEAGIEVNRPTAQTVTKQEKGNIIIAISKDGEIWLEKRQLDMRMVRPTVERLHAANPEGAVIIVADKDTATGVTVQVMDQVRLAGIANVSIAASREAGGAR